MSKLVVNHHEVEVGGPSISSLLSIISKLCKMWLS